MADLETIGTDSTLTESDRNWLMGLSELLYDEGWYTKSIYLNELISKASGDCNETCK